MAEYQLSEAEAERILQLDKWIEARLTWRQDDAGNWFVRVPLECSQQQNLEWYARYNPRTGNYTSILFSQKHINLRRLDVGKLHPNLVYCCQQSYTAVELRTGVLAGAETPVLNQSEV